MMQLTTAYLLLRTALPSWHTTYQKEKVQFSFTPQILKRNKKEHIKSFLKINFDCILLGPKYCIMSLCVFRYLQLPNAWPFFFLHGWIFSWCSTLKKRKKGRKKNMCYHWGVLAFYVKNKGPKNFMGYTENQQLSLVNSDFDLPCVSQSAKANTSKVNTIPPSNSSVYSDKKVICARQMPSVSKC